MGLAIMLDHDDMGLTTMSDPSHASPKTLESGDLHLFKIWRAKL
jgi:hypothetical protein